MRTTSFSRRTWIQTGMMAAGAAATGVFDVRAAPLHWPIGCFNRPWMQVDAPVSPVGTSQPANWGLDVALTGMSQAGFKLTGLLTRTQGEPFIGSEATPEYLAGLKGKIAAAGLVAIVGALRCKADVAAADGMADLHTQIDHAQALGLRWLLTFGADDRSQYETYVKMMAEAADYAQERGLKVVIKPHGSGASGAQLLACLKAVGRPNFKIWFDPGNIIYYTGGDPLAELSFVLPHVTGFCAKDCGAQNGEVMIRFGRGKVNFQPLFAALRDAGFAGPVFVETAGGKTFAQVTAVAQRNREYIETTISTLSA